MAVIYFWFFTRMLLINKQNLNNLIFQYLLSNSWLNRDGLAISHNWAALLKQLTFWSLQDKSIIVSFKSLKTYLNFIKACLK